MSYRRSEISKEKNRGALEQCFVLTTLTCVRWHQKERKGVRKDTQCRRVPHGVANPPRLVLLVCHGSGNRKRIEGGDTTWKPTRAHIITTDNGKTPPYLHAWKYRTSKVTTEHLAIVCFYQRNETFTSTVIELVF